MDRHGRKILKNPGPTGKYYVIDKNGKKEYKIDKNLENTNVVEYFTVDQLREFCKKYGIKGYSSMKKDDLWKALMSSKTYFYDPSRNRYRTFSDIINNV